MTAPSYRQATVILNTQQVYTHKPGNCAPKVLQDQGQLLCLCCSLRRAKEEYETRVQEFSFYFSEPNNKNKGIGLALPIPLRGGGVTNGSPCSDMICIFYKRHDFNQKCSITSLFCLRRSQACLRDLYLPK